MSVKLYLSVKAKHPMSGGSSKNADFAGKYMVSLRADTPESALAAAAYDTLIHYLDIDNGEAFDVTTRDSRGQIVLDTSLPAIGSMAGFGLSAIRVDTAAA